MKTLKIDDTWSIEYDPDNNDAPRNVLRHGEPNEMGGVLPNIATAMFYALLDREREDETCLIAKRGCTCETCRAAFPGYG